MKNNKGFTLIELLAVIAILAILVVLAVPAILKIFTSSKKDSFIVQAQEVYKAAEQQIVNKQMQNPNVKISKFDSNEDENKIDLNGKQDIDYCIKVYDNKIISIAISDGNFWYINNDITTLADISYDDLEKFGTGEKNFSCDEDGTTTFSTITLTTDQGTSGIDNYDIVTISSGSSISEQFYVIDTNPSKTTLVAKYNLLVGDYITYDSTLPKDEQHTHVKHYTTSDAGYGLQNSSIRGYDGTSDIKGIVPFSFINYWDDYQCYYDKTTGEWINLEYLGNSSPQSLKNKYASNGASYSGNPYPYVYESNMSNVSSSLYYYQGIGYEENPNYTIAYYVKRYLNKLGISGTARLLTYEEANTIKQEKMEIISNGSFWTGSASNNHNIRGVEYNGNIPGHIYLYYYEFGVRPAIVVSTSDIHTS